MRVLLLCSTYFPKIGGAETYVLNISQALGSLGHAVEVVTDGVPGEPLPNDLNPAITVRRVNRYRQYLEAPDRILWEEMQLGLRPEIDEIAQIFEPDLVFSNSLDLCAMAKTTSLAHDIPWVATFHEQAPEREPMGLATLRICYGLLQPSAVIAGSEFYLQRAHRFTAREKCHLIYHGIDTQGFRPLDSREDVRRRYRIPAEHHLLVSLGRFKARKGFDTVIEAVAALARTGMPVSLVIAGSLNSASADYLAEIENLASAHGVRSSVHFEHELSHERAPWLLSGADIVVQASREEGLGLAVIEAMACGKPVIATRIPGHTEIADDEDQLFFVTPSSSHDLAAAIRSLVDDRPLQRTLGRNARARAQRAFSLEAMGSMTAALLEEAIVSHVQQQA